MLTQRQLQLLTYIDDYVREHRVPPSFEEMRNALALKSKSGVHRLISGLEERGYIRRLAYRARALEITRMPEARASLTSVRRAEDAVAADRADGPRAGPDEAAHRFPVGDLVERGLETADRESADGSNIVRGKFRPTPRAAGNGDDGNHSVPLLGRIAAGAPIEALADHGAAIEVPTLLMGNGEHYILQISGDSMVEAGIVDGDYAVIQRCETAENGTIVVALIEDREVTLKRLRRRGASVALEAANPAYETRIFGPHQVEVQGRLVGLLRRY